MQTLIVVLAHKAEESTFKRHLPLWQKHGLPIWIVTDETLDTDLPQFVFGPCDHQGTRQVVRFEKMIDLLLKPDRFDRFVLFEYDSFCVRPLSPLLEHWANPSMGLLPGAFVGNVGINYESGRFSSPVYFGFPWFMDKQVVLTLRRFLPLDVNFEGGFLDRMMGALIQKAEIPALPTNRLCYCPNTITKEMWPEVLQRIEKDRICLFHGVKEPDTLNFILAATHAWGIE